MTENEKTANRRTAPAWAWILVLLIATVFAYVHYGLIEQLQPRSAEIHMLNMAQGMMDLETASETDGHCSPLYARTVSIVMRWAGPGIGSLRLPALFFAVLCIPAMFVFIRRLAPGGLAVLSTAVLAFSPTFNGFALDGTAYSMFFFMLLMAYIFLLRLCGKPTLRDRLLVLLLLIGAYDASSYAVLSFIPGSALLGMEAWKMRKAGDAAGEARAGQAQVWLIISLLVAGSLAWFNFGSGTWIVTSASGLHKELSEWAGALVVGAYGGLGNSAGTLAAYALPVSLYGIVTLAGFRRRTAVSATLSVIAIVLVAGVVFRTGARPAWPPMFQNYLGYVLAVILPFTALTVAAGIYFFVVRAFSVRALQIYTVGRLLRFLVGGMVMIVLIAGWTYMSIMCLRDVFMLERESWRAVTDYIQNRLEPGDTIFYNWKDETPIKYYLARELGEDARLEMTFGEKDVVAGATSLRRSWYIRRRPPEFFRGEKSEFEELLDFEGYHREFHGLYNMIHLNPFYGVLVIDRTDVEINGGDSRSASHGASAVEVKCENNDPCWFNMCSIEKDGYKFTFIPAEKGGESLSAVRLCGNIMNVEQTGENEYSTRAGIPQGFCEIEVRRPGEGMTITIEKDRPIEPGG